MMSFLFLVNIRKLDPDWNEFWCDVFTTSLKPIVSFWIIFFPHLFGPCSHLHQYCLKFEINDVKSISRHCDPSDIGLNPLIRMQNKKVFILHMDVIVLVFNDSMTFILILGAINIPSDIF